jgi:hypothetical protein
MIGEFSRLGGTGVDHLSCSSVRGALDLELQCLKFKKLVISFSFPPGLCIYTSTESSVEFIDFVAVVV